jgi:hypothetical protein
MNWVLGVFLGLAAVLGMAFAQTAPWSNGEKLTYRLAWQGVGVGKLYLSAEVTEGGWKLRGKLETQGMASVTGYGLEAESYIGPDFYTDRFWKNLTEPFKGTTRLTFERAENQGSWARVSYPGGNQSQWRSPVEEVLDDLSLIYFLRVFPPPVLVNAVDYPKLAQGQLEAIKKDGLLGYRFAKDGVLVEVWYRPDAKRTPAKVIFGRDAGRLEATLIGN